MSTDRELLELAAKAAGLRPAKYVEGFGLLLNGSGAWWNPLTDDGDAFRLSVRLRLLVDICADHTCVCSEKVDPLEQSHGNDDMAATRRAIVRAAAEIGRNMP